MVRDCIVVRLVCGGVAGNWLADGFLWRFAGFSGGAAIGWFCEGWFFGRIAPEACDCG